MQVGAEDVLVAVSPRNYSFPLLPQIQPGTLLRVWRACRG